MEDREKAKSAFVRRISLLGTLEHIHRAESKHGSRNLNIQNKYVTVHDNSSRNST